MSNASRELAPAIMVQCDAWRLPRDAWRLPRGRPYRQPQLLGIAPTSLEYHKKAAQKGGYKRVRIFFSLAELGTKFL